jgi:hypothetical protein
MKNKNIPSCHEKNHTYSKLSIMFLVLGLLELRAKLISLYHQEEFANLNATNYLHL